MNIYVPLRPDEVERLRDLAIRERRSVKQQAAHLIARGLLLVPEPEAQPAEEVRDAVSA